MPKGNRAVPRKCIKTFKFHNCRIPEHQLLPPEAARKIPAIACRGLSLKDLARAIVKYAVDSFDYAVEPLSMCQPPYYHLLPTDNINKPRTYPDPSNLIDYPQPSCSQRLKVQRCTAPSTQKTEESHQPKTKESHQPLTSATTQGPARPPSPEQRPVVHNKEEAMKALKKALTSCKSFLGFLEAQETCSVQMGLLLREVGEWKGANGKEAQKMLQAGPAEDPIPGCSSDRRYGGVPKVAARVEATAAAIEAAVEAASSVAAEVLFDNEDDIEERDVTYSTVGERIFWLSLEYMTQAFSGTQMLGVSQANNLNSSSALKETLEIFANLVQAIIELRVYLKNFSRTQMAGEDNTRMPPEPEQADDHSFDHSQERGHVAAAQMPSDQEARSEAKSEVKDLTTLLTNFTEYLEDNPFVFIPEELLEDLKLGSPGKS